MKINLFSAVAVFRGFSKMASHQAKFVWIDCEMTGLDESKDEIMEVACIVTTPELESCHPGFNTIIHVSEEKLRAMDAWCTEQHGKNGLTEQCKNSTVSLKQAESELYDYIQAHRHKDDRLYLAGSSVSYDKVFLKKYMPRVNSLLHYRIVDTSSIKTVSALWTGFEVQKKSNHRALDDIRASIKELQAYKSRYFNTDK